MPNDRPVLTQEALWEAALIVSRSGYRHDEGVSSEDVVKELWEFFVSLTTKVAKRT